MTRSRTSPEGRSGNWLQTDVEDLPMSIDDVPGFPCRGCSESLWTESCFKQSTGARRVRDDEGCLDHDGRLMNPEAVYEATSELLRAYERYIAP